MIIIARLNYYDDTTNTIPIEASSTKSAYEKVRDVIRRYRKDCNEYRDWFVSEEYVNSYDNIILKISKKKKERNEFVDREMNFEITEERVVYFSKLDEINNQISKLELELTNLFNSRREPREIDYASFRITGLYVSDYDFITLEDWLEQKGEVYD